MLTVWLAIRRVFLGVTLISITSGVLLFSDWDHRKTAASALPVSGRAFGRTFKAGIVYFARDVGTDLCVQGLVDGLRAGGFEEGRNLEVRRTDAQGEMANIPAMLQNYDNSDVDLIMTISTPCLTGACNSVKHKSVVFTCVTDPIAAGAGTSRSDHLPFVTGVGSFPPVGHMLALMQKFVPGLRAVGTIYNPAEANSVKELSVARPIYRSRGVRLEEIAVSNSSEVFQAVQILAGKDIQAVLAPGDNTAIAGYEGAVKGAQDAHLPLFSEDCDSLDRGGVACLGLGAHVSGLAAGRLAGRILQGASPRDLPFEEVAVEEIGIRSRRAAQLGLRIPAEFAKNVRP